MIPVEEALETILSHFEILEAEDEEILSALGRVLAEDVHSTISIPPMDNSAMDGYAVQATSILGATASSPTTLRVIGEIAAGYLTKDEVTPGTAIRIMTGAPIPAGADTVVPFEDTDEETRSATREPLAEIGITAEIERGQNIRRAGEDIAAGSLVLTKGTLLRPQEIGVLASLGRDVVSVVRRPVVAILATGDELVEVGKPLPPGRIYNSNSYSLASQVLRYGGVPRIIGIGPDNIQALESKIREARDADLLITSAGVSVGDYDVVKNVLAKEGEIAFWTVRMKPGKPLAFGLLKLGKRVVPHVGLPGNPVSAMISFEQFARPAILKMLGRTVFDKPTVIAVSDSRVKNTDGRRIYARVRVRFEDGQYHARVVGPQGSGILTSMSLANGLMIVPEDADSVEAGDEVTVQMLDWDMDL
jgi:molybdopterin molybdotransferase